MSSFTGLKATGWTTSARMTPATKLTGAASPQIAAARSDTARVFQIGRTKCCVDPEVEPDQVDTEEVDPPIAAHVLAVPRSSCFARKLERPDGEE